MTSNGHVPLFRRYRICPHCKHKSFPADVTLGTKAGYTDGLLRLVTRSCGFWSYQDAADNLEEFCCIHLSHTTVGDLAGKTSVELSDKVSSSTIFREIFQNAKGETEFYTDGTFVHTLNGDCTREWREMRVGAHAKRILSESALPTEWATRELQEPTVVLAFAAIESAKKFQERVAVERRRIGVGGVSSALGDGAPWIWNIVREVYGKTDECLDIYHALERVSDLGKVLYGNGEAFTSWLDKMRLVLLSEGFGGMERELQSLQDYLTGKSKKAKDHRKAVSSLLEYLRKNAARLHYAERLSAGRAIGSGLIEGACKNLVGRRMKQTGASWRLEQANKMAFICSLLYSKQWKNAWKIPKII